VYDTVVQRGGGHAALWYCSWGYTARLGGPPREALSTVALRGVHPHDGWGHTLSRRVLTCGRGASRALSPPSGKCLCTDDFKVKYSSQYTRVKPPKTPSSAVRPCLSGCPPPARSRAGVAAPAAPAPSARVPPPPARRSTSLREFNRDSRVANRVV
jgi:hypothetical protein